MLRTETSQRGRGIRMAILAGFPATMAPVWALAETTVATVPGSAVDFYSGPDMMGSWGPGMMGAFALFWGLLCLLVVAGIIGGIAFLIRGAFVCRHRHGCRGGAAANGGVAALKLLDERYARGEIQREEYLEKRGDLEK